MMEISIIIITKLSNNENVKWVIEAYYFNLYHLKGQFCNKLLNLPYLVQLCPGRNRKCEKKQKERGKGGCKVKTCYQHAQNKTSEIYIKLSGKYKLSYKLLKGKKLLYKLSPI